MTTDANKRILIVDDQKSIHDDFRMILADQGDENGSLDNDEEFLFGTTPAETATENYQLVSAYQGEEGIDCVRQSVAEGRPYSVAFVDVRMPPGIDGVETIERMWKIDPRIHVVMCTAFSDYSWDEIRQRLEDSDRMIILKKPFENIEVRQVAIMLTKTWATRELLELLEQRR